MSAAKKMLRPLQADQSNPIVPWQQKMQMAAYGAVSEADIQEIVQGMVAKAKAGDAKAIQQVFDLFLAPKNPPAMTQNNLIVEAPPASEPTTGKPGSNAKILEMSRRAAKGECVFHDDDHRDDLK